MYIYFRRGVAGANGYVRCNAIPPSRTKLPKEILYEFVILAIILVNVRDDRNQNLNKKIKNCKLCIEVET